MNEEEFKIPVLAFIDGVRTEQFQHGKPLNGPIRIDADMAFLVHSAAVAVFMSLKNKGILQIDHIEQLGLRFEEMCRRRKMNIKNKWRTAILRRLTAELLLNHRSIKMPPDKLIRITLYHGNIGSALLKQFPEFTENPSVIKRAATGYYSNPHAYLQHVANDIAELTKDAMYKELPRWALMQAAVNCSTTSRQYLDRVMADIDAMKHNVEFQDIADQTPWMITRAAVAYKNPSNFLVRAQEDIKSMAEEFHGSTTVPALKRAVAHRPTDARSLVRQKLKEPTPMQE